MSDAVTNSQISSSYNNQSDDPEDWETQINASDQEQGIQQTQNSNASELARIGSPGFPNAVGASNSNQAGSNTSGSLNDAILASLNGSSTTSSSSTNYLSNALPDDRYQHLLSASNSNTIGSVLTNYDASTSHRDWNLDQNIDHYLHLEQSNTDMDEEDMQELNDNFEYIANHSPTFRNLVSAATNEGHNPVTVRLSNDPSRTPGSVIYNQNANSIDVSVTSSVTDEDVTSYVLNAVAMSAHSSDRENIRLTQFQSLHAYEPGGNIENAARTASNQQMRVIYQRLSEVDQVGDEVEDNGNDQQLTDHLFSGHHVVFGGRGFDAWLHLPQNVQNYNRVSSNFRQAGVDQVRQLSSIEDNISNLDADLRHNDASNDPTHDAWITPLDHIRTQIANTVLPPEQRESFAGQISSLQDQVNDAHHTSIIASANDLADSIRDAEAGQSTSSVRNWQDSLQHISDLVGASEEYSQEDRQDVSQQTNQIISRIQELSEENSQSSETPHLIASAILTSFLVLYGRLARSGGKPDSTSQFGP